MSIVKFSEVAHRAYTREDRFNTEKIYYVGGEHIDSCELYVTKKGVIKGSTIGPMFYCGFTAGQILFVTRNPHLKKCSIADFDGICSEKTFVIETKDESILTQEYLAIIMQSDDFWNYCEENKSGGVNYFLNWSTLADYEFELPPIKQQLEIAQKVMSAYRLKQSYKKLLDATREMVKSQFIEMVGDPRNNPKGWPTKRLSELAEYSIGLTYKPEQICDDGTIVLRSGNIQDGKISFSDIVRVNAPIKESLFVKEDDILMCSRNGSASLVGKVAMIPDINEPMTFGAFMTIIRSAEAKYLYLYFQSQDFRERVSEGKSSTMNQITQKMLDKVEVPFPDKDVREALSAIASQADKSKSVIQKALVYLNDIQSDELRKIA